MSRNLLTLLFVLVAAPSAAQPLRLGPRDLGPCFTSAAHRDAAQRLAAGDAEGARTLLLSTGAPPEAERDAARMLLAAACVEARDWLGALALLDGFDERVPLVADRIRLLRGTARAALGQHEEAVRDLERVDPRSVVGRDARSALAGCLEALGRHDEAAKCLGDLVAAGRRDPETVGRWANALLAAGRRDDAVAALRKAFFDAAAAGRSVYRRTLEAMGVRVEPTDREALDHAQALLDAHRSDEAAAEARGLAGRPDPAVRCPALLIQGGALTKLRQHGDALAAFTAALDDCGPRIDVPRTLFNAVRAAFRSGQGPRGDLLAERLRTEFPAATYNDDVAVMRARSAATRGDTDAADRILAASLELAPDGDMAHESRWLLAWAAYKRGERPKALARLEAGAREADGDPEYGPRFAYWRGRTLQRAGREAEAGKAFRAVVRDWPLSFYGTLALHRLAGIEGTTPAGALKAAAPPAPTLGPYLTVSDRSILDQGPAARALWLARAGLADAAAEEIDGSESDGDAAWLAAAILDAAGRYTRSHRLAAGLFRKAACWPTAETLGYLRLAWPRPWPAEVAAAAKQSGVDPALIWAVMREESAFVAGIESRANAIGLMQLILPTARSVAARLKLEATPDALRRPEVNIRLGAGYLSELLKQLKEPLLAIPGYNAGGGAISRWLREHPGAPLDEFVEDIGAGETRDYARKVFGSYVAYRYLYGEGAARFAPLKLDAGRRGGERKEKLKPGKPAKRVPTTAPPRKPVPPRKR